MLISDTLFLLCSLYLSVSLMRYIETFTTLVNMDDNNNVLEMTNILSESFSLSLSLSLFLFPSLPVSLLYF